MKFDREGMGIIVDVNFLYYTNDELQRIDSILAAGSIRSIE